jgi:membrane fusion protein (multidrug efflux system)
MVVMASALVLAGGAGAYWHHVQGFEGTDDAQIDGTISNVSPRVTGTVTAVRVVENQMVKVGDVLAELDTTDLTIALAQAKAQVAQAEAQLAAEDPNVPIIETSNATAVASALSDVTGAQAGLSAARKEVQQLTAQLAQGVANDRQAELEKQRSEKLLAEGAVAQSDYDQRLNAAAASAANVDAIRQSLAAAQDRVAQQQAQIAALQSRVTEVRSNAPRQVETRRASLGVRAAALELAKAEEAQAAQNLAYAKILAPVSGVVAKKAIAVGDHVAPGQQVVAISQTDSLWVTANFRETQLEAMHAGQPVSLHVDALGQAFRGTIESIGGATGSRLSVLPPENASGNYVKVVQRIPVRVHFDDGQPGLDRLRIGMSVEPEVTVR